MIADIVHNNDKNLKRYTTLSSAINILKSKQLTLLKTDNWDDANDRECINIYKDNANIDELFALCFTSAPETYHHWKVFTNNVDGVCIVFNKNKLLDSIRSVSNLRSGEIKYSIPNELSSCELANLPFNKMKSYQDEQEYRIIFEGSRKSKVKKIDFDFSALEIIYFNPWIDDSLFDTAAELLKSIEKCNNITILKSDITLSIKWRNAALISTV